MGGRAPALAASSPRCGVRAPALVALVVVLGLGAHAAAGQELNGVALGPDGDPLIDVPVLLHRVGVGGGAMAGTDTTGPAGEFSFPLEAQDSAVYFAALRYEDRLYVGPAAQAGGASVTDYVLRVESASEVGAVGAALADPGSPPQAAARPGPQPEGSGDAGAIWLVVLLALAAAGVFIFTAPRYRQRRTRDAVMEVAGIENRLADPSGELSSADRQRLEQRRDRLKEQLAPGD